MTLNTAGLDRFLAELPETIDMGVDDIAKEVLKVSQADVPIDTGELKSSGVVTGEAGSGQRIVGYGKGLPDARAVHQEYGTDRATAQPFLTPAATQTDAGAIVAKRIQALASKSRI